ncbi:unnamed protein product [Calicophoron daubneyi]|uniref:Centrosomal protein of 97 kDa n=1 Tax=Calicophoron daubneyi TaxID=300641 RepID=A0AAV2SZQ9_CALDB
MYKLLRQGFQDIPTTLGPNGEVILNLAKRELDRIEPVPANVNVLILDHNYIRRLENLVNLYGLQQLSVAGNKLFQMHGVAQLTNLTILNLPNNGIVAIDGLQKLVRLRWLNLSCNHLKSIEQLEGNVNLRHLDLSENFIRELGDISFLGKLKTFLLHCNRIESLVNASKLLPRSLEILSLAGNMIACLADVQHLQPLRGITQFSIQNNPCTASSTEDDDSSILSWLPNLRILNGSQIPPETRARAEHLKMEECRRAAYSKLRDSHTLAESISLSSIPEMSNMVSAMPRLQQCCANNSCNVAKIPANGTYYERCGEIPGAPPNMCPAEHEDRLANGLWAEPVLKGYNVPQNGAPYIQPPTHSRTGASYIHPPLASAQKGGSCMQPPPTPILMNDQRGFCPTTNSSVGHLAPVNENVNVMMQQYTASPARPQAAYYPRGTCIHEPVVNQFSPIFRHAGANSYTPKNVHLNENLQLGDHRVDPTFNQNSTASSLLISESVYLPLDSCHSASNEQHTVLNGGDTSLTPEDTGRANPPLSKRPELSDSLDSITSRGFDSSLVPNCSGGLTATCHTLSSSSNLIPITGVGDIKSSPWANVLSRFFQGQLKTLDEKPVSQSNLFDSVHLLSEDGSDQEGTDKPTEDPMTAIFQDNNVEDQSVRLEPASSRSSLCLQIKESPERNAVSLLQLSPRAITSERPCLSPMHRRDSTHLSDPGLNSTHRDAEETPIPVNENRSETSLPPNSVSETAQLLAVSSHLPSNCNVDDKLQLVSVPSVRLSDHEDDKSIHSATTSETPCPTCGAQQKVLYDHIVFLRTQLQAQYQAAEAEAKLRQLHSKAIEFLLREVQELKNWKQSVTEENKKRKSTSDALTDRLALFNAASLPNFSSFRSTMRPQCSLSHSAEMTFNSPDVPLIRRWGGTSTEKLRKQRTYPLPSSIGKNRKENATYPASSTKAHNCHAAKKHPPEVVRVYASDEDEDADSVGAATSNLSTQPVNSPLNNTLRPQESSFSSLVSHQNIKPSPDVFTASGHPVTYKEDHEDSTELELVRQAVMHAMSLHSSNSGADEEVHPYICKSEELSPSPSV